MHINPVNKRKNSEIKRLRNKISKLENRLHSQNELLNFILGYSNICYIITNIEGIIEKVNIKCSKLIGYKVNEIKKKSILEIIVNENKKPLNLNDLVTDKFVSNIAICKANNNKDIKIHIAGIKAHDEQYAKEHFYFVIEPLELTQITENELKYERDLLQVLMDNIPDSIYFKDKNSKFTRINKAQAKLLGIKNPEDSLGKNDFDYFSLDHAQKAYNDEKEIIKTGKPIINKEERLAFEDRPTIWVSTTKVGIENTSKGEIGQIVGITRDITSKKNAEENLKIAFEKAKEADRLKSAFLANMSH